MSVRSAIPGATEECPRGDTGHHGDRADVAAIPLRGQTKGDRSTNARVKHIQRVFRRP